MREHDWLPIPDKTRMFLRFGMKESELRKTYKCIRCGACKTLIGGIMSTQEASDDCDLVVIQGIHAQ